MFDQNVHFSSLRVIQARGITRDNQFELEGLGNVNIIYGRNGVGKSTVGLTIYKLLRPSGNLLPKSAEVGGVVRVGEQELDLKVAVSQGHATLDGATHDYPDFKSAGDLSGYRLALEELINEDDVEFAKVIADETRGGIDLRAVSKLIDAREKPQRPLKLENEWRSLYQAEEACREHQSEVARKEQRLEALKTEQFELLATLRLQDALKASQAANVHQAALQELGLLLSEYPEGIAKFNGGEAKELAKLQSDLEQIRVQIENSEGVEAEVRKRLVPLGHLDALTRLDLNRLEELQVAYAESQRKLEVAQSEGKRIEGKAKRLVAEFPDEETVEDLESRLADVDLTEIDTTYQRFLVKQQRLRETEISLNLLQVDSSSESGRDKEEALRRYQDLVTWCGASDQQQYDAVNFAGRLLTTSSVVLGVWATILGISVHPLWLFGLLVPAVVMGFYMNSKRHRNQETPTRQDLEASEAHRFPELEEWSAEAVKKLMDVLIQQISQASLDEIKHHRLKATEQELVQSEKEFQVAREALIDLAKNFGLSLSGIDSELMLIQLAQTFMEWKSCVAELAGVQAVMVELQERLVGQEGALFRELAAFGIEVSEVATSFRAEVNEASARLSERNEVQNALVTAERETMYAREKAGQVESQIETLLERLGAVGKSPSDLEALESRLPEYTKLEQGRLNAEALLREAKATVETCLEVKELTDRQVNEALMECEGAQDRLQHLAEQIQEIQTKIEAIQQGTVLADAMTAKDEKSDELRDHFQAALQSLAGFCLVDYLIQETEGENTSHVFEKASANLHRITGGKFTLAVSAKEDIEEFVISDAIGAKRGLNALSVGERVQVLLAVRLAFLSTGETSSLPIVVDEALGTADDDRAHEIIESFVKLAQGGRQVFYFTAQTDEVEKWKSVLRGYEGIQSTFVDLDHLRGFDPNESTEDTRTFVQQNIVPAPGEMSYEQYGQQLGVSLPNAREFKAATLSLWAVLDDVNDLYRCWQRRIRTVGMLEDTLRLNELNVLEPHVARLAMVRSKALETAVDQYLSGRPLPLQIDDLVVSGAFPDRWLEPVWSLASEVGYDGRRLVHMLRAGRLKRWRQTYTESLEASLRADGKICESEVASADQIEAVATVVFVREDIEAEGQMEWLLTRLYQILGDYRAPEC